MSYGSRSSLRRTNTAAPAAFTWSRSPMSTMSRARAKSIAAARSTARPARRSARPNPTARPSRSCPSTWRGISPFALARGRLGQELLHALAAHVADVLLVLEDDAQGLVDDLRIELGRAERQERSGPIERLGDARHLGQVRRA